MPVRTITPVLLVVLLLASCGSAGGAGGDPFGGSTWVLVAGSADGAAIVPIDGYPVTLRVEDGQAGGTAACNGYGGAIVVTGGALSFPDGISQTEMACMEPGVMELEAAYLSALLRVTGAASADNELRLTGPAVELRFAPLPPEPDASLIGTMWTLETLVEGETASTAAAEATLHIGEAGKVTGSTGCNSMNGAYSEAGGFAPFATTKMACEPQVMDQERLVLAVLGADPTLTIEGSQLTIADLEGRALQYRAGS
jgi:heat shock protein HslJ